MSTVIQRAFSGGELSPSLRARVDISKYQTGCSILRNFQVQRYGGACNRAGTAFVGEVKDSTQPVRLIPFVFNNDQTYVLEFGDLYMRVIKNGAYVQVGTFTIASATNANPAVFTYGVGDLPGLKVGDQIIMQGAWGYTNKRFTINSLPSPTTFTVKDQTGQVLDSTNLGAFGTATYTVIYQIASPFSITDLPLVEYVQSADVVSFAHRNYAPKKLSRTGDTSWSFSDYVFSPSVTWPTLTSLTAGGAGSVVNKYRYTSISKATGEESLLSTAGKSGIVYAITNANPAVVTARDPFTVAPGPHGLSNGDTVTLKYKGGTTPHGMVEVNGATYTVTVIDANRFSINVDSTSFGVFSNSTPVLNFTTVYDRIDAAAPTTTAPIVFKFTASTDIAHINVYKEQNGIYGYLGTTDVDTSGHATFNDYGLAPDISDRGPVDNNPFTGNANYPQAIAYIQQRLCFASTASDPEKVWMSRTGQFTNFTTSIPVADDNSVSFRLAGNKVNEVRYLLDIGQFVVMTSGGEWLVNGDQNNAVTPSSVSLKQQSYNGSVMGLQPITIDNTAIYTQARGTIIRDLAYNFQSDGYTGNDITIFSAHLFDKFTLKDWAYQQVPHSTLWAVRSDGTLLGMTYVKEQQILAWHRHDTDGVYENVCAVPEGQEDALYAVVRRTVNGRQVRYVERFATRKIYDLRDSCFVDCSLTFDGRNTDLTKSVTLSGAAWTYEDALTLTASSALFSATDVGSQVHLRDVSGNVIRLSISGYTSPTVVTVVPDRTVPVGFRSVPLTNWAKAVKSVSGLQHLEGKTVSVMADASIAASANNPNYEPVVVTNGAITLDKCYSVIRVGLAYTSDLQTLAIDSAQSETLLNKSKLVNQVTVSVEETRGGWVGTEPPKGLDQTEGLNEFKPRRNEPYDQPTSLVTTTETINIQSSWDKNGRVLIRQLEPLPISILAIAPSGLMPFRQG